MPTVRGKSFPYTAKGKAAAEEAKQRGPAKRSPAKPAMGRGPAKRSPKAKAYGRGGKRG